MFAYSFPRRFFLAVAVVLLLSERAPAQPDFQTVKEQVAASWERLRLVSRSVQVEGEEKTLDRLANDRLVSHVKFRHRSSPQCYLMENEVVVSTARSKQGNPPSSTVLGFNTRYAFELKNPGAGSSGWRLSQTRMNDSPEPLSRHLDVNYHVSLSRALQPYQNESYAPLPDLFAHPSFKLIECGPAPENRGCVRVRYEARAMTGHPEQLSRGWLDLDPAAAWSVREADEQMVDGATQIASRTRIAVALTDGVPLIRSCAIDVKQSVNGKVKLDQNITTAYTCSITEGIPEAEFTLSAYGLPEPVGVAFEKPTPTYLWFVAAAAGCALLALAVGYLARRAQRRATPAT